MCYDLISPMVQGSMLCVTKCKNREFMGSRYALREQMVVMIQYFIEQSDLPFFLFIYLFLLYLILLMSHITLYCYFQWKLAQI